MEQLEFDIEEATSKRIVSANGERTESLGKIKDFPIKISNSLIPINVEVMETDSYNILLGNDWMMKAGTTYNWKNQELTLDWRNQRIKVNASCKQIRNLKEESDSEEDNESDNEERILFQKNHKQK